MNFRALADRLLDWIYPPQCVSCGAPGTLLCPECRSKLQPVGEHYCSKCGKPLQKGKPCRLCAESVFHFRSCRAPYIYSGPAADMIKKLKYNNCLGLVPILSDLLLDFRGGPDWEVDLMLPVPLSDKRKAERGFNQSELIAKAFAKKAGIPFTARALMKIRHTAQQVGLNADERKENLTGAFAAESVLVKGKRLLLLDDVMTTGSTFSECSGVLLAAGARSVDCISVATAAIGYRSHDMPDRVRHEKIL